MGRSGGKKKKASVAAASVTVDGDKKNTAAANPVDDDKKNNNGSIAVPPAAPSSSAAAAAAAADLLKRAHELKEEGNRWFQERDYPRALEQYDLALKLTPRSHPDRAVFHSNRAACLMQMRPVDHHAVAAECSLALQAQPGFTRALIRRARALEGLGSYDLAYLDVQTLLASDPTHRDALELSSRLQSVLSSRNHHQLPSRPSPAALGASAVRGAPIAGIGPCLPSRPAPKKSPSSHLSPSSTKQPPPAPHDPLPNGLKPTFPPPAAACALKSPKQAFAAPPDPVNEKQQPRMQASEAAPLRRPLKLVYDHDIRLAEMPAKCSFRMLREIVSKRFPSSHFVLIKYKDCDSDLVTITSTAELRLAELCVDQATTMDAKNEGKGGNGSQHALKMLRLHIVDVSPEQEPPFIEEEQVQREDVVYRRDVEENPIEDNNLVKGDESLPNSFKEDLILGSAGNNEPVKSSSEEEAEKVVAAVRDKECNHAECKEGEMMDDWLFEFAQLFRNHIGIDPDAHLDLHELGMEFYTEALEETVTSEEAQDLFDMAASKFQEVAALAFFNWGNVHMCAARKRIPPDDPASKEVLTTQLQSAYNWMQERYALAGQKYEESLRIKPDFYEGLLALGQQHFENAKLQWSFALANKVDLKSWDSSQTFQLFDSAQEKIKVATKMWEKFEEQRTNELKDPANSKKDELLRRKKNLTTHMDGQSSLDVRGELSDEIAEQAAVMRSQIHLFWGNMLFERSQVEFKLGFSGWKKNLDAGVERFKLAGASETDISAVLKNHYSKDVKNADSNATEALVKDEDKHVS